MAWIFSLILAGSVFAQPQLVTVNKYDSFSGREFAVSVVQEETETSEQVFPINPDGRIEVSNINGSIKIESWDRAEVKLISKKVAKTRERLADIEVKATSTPEYLKVEVDYKRWQGKWVKGDDLYVNFSLMVPRTAVLNEIESVNGSVEISGVHNVTSVSAVNGSVRASDLKGSVDLSTVNGSLVAEFREVTSNSVISLETVNGSAEIRLPSNVDATVKADSVNGSITNAFGLPVRKGEYVGRDLYGRIGSGASKIRLNSVNGSLKILRLDDGLPLKPVKNLLPQKMSDDFDDSFTGKLAVPADLDITTASEAALAARDSAKAAGKFDKEAMKAAREIEKEAAKLAREIDKETMKSAAAIAAETALLATEAVTASLSTAELAELDESRLAAELARVRLNVFGNRPAPFIVEDSKTVSIEGVPNLTVEAYGANVVVRGWDKKEVKYSVSRIAYGSMSPVQNVSFEEKKGGLELQVKLIGGSGNEELLEQVRVEIFVPKNSNLKISTNREIRVEGVVGNLKLSGKSGPVNVRDSAGNLDVFSKTAIIRVIGFEGRVNAEAYDADMYLEGNFEAISSKLEGGDVILTVGDDTGATIYVNRTDKKGAVGGYGKELYAEGLRLENKADGVWQLGGGESEFKFSFDKGSLKVRSLNAVADR